MSTDKQIPIIPELYDRLRSTVDKAGFHDPDLAYEFRPLKRDERVRYMASRIPTADEVAASQEVWAHHRREAAKKSRQLGALVKSFANPHDAAHLAICASICTTLHFVLEFIL